MQFTRKISVDQLTSPCEPGVVQPESSPGLLAQIYRVSAAKSTKPKKPRGCRSIVLAKRAPRLRAYKSPRTDVPQSPGNFY